MPTPQYLNEEAKLAREVVDYCHSRFSELSEDARRLATDNRSALDFIRTLWKKQYLEEELIQARLRIKELEKKGK